MNVSEFEPVIRISLFVASGYLINAGLPPEMANMIISDPVIFEAVSQVVGLLVAGVTFAWWRLAKRWGRAT